MVTLLIPYERDKNYLNKIYSHMILSILRICENFEKKVNLILVDMNSFLGIFSNFLRAFSTVLGVKIFWDGSILLRVTSTFWTTVLIN